MLDWTEKSSAVLRQGGVIAPDERLPWQQTAAITLVLGTGNFTLKSGPFALGGIGTATLGAILLYALLNRRR
ncbi:MAG: hypothetical protein ABJA84_00375 [Polaromonas sp.]